MSGRREIQQTSEKARLALEDVVFAMYLAGKTTIGPCLWYDCIGDQVVYDRLIRRITHCESSKEVLGTDKDSGARAGLNKILNSD